MERVEPRPLNPFVPILAVGAVVGIGVSLCSFFGPESVQFLSLSQSVWVLGISGGVLLSASTTLISRALTHEAVDESLK
ncbi:MAG: hypothetical protein AB7F31_00370 [Parachlamydiales bacterium]